jgi:hypothetical protein
MRLEALLIAAGLAVATAGTAAASPDDTLPTCARKGFLAEMVCKAQHPAKPPSAPKSNDMWSLVDRVMHPRTAFDWFRERFDQLGNKTMISSSTRPSTKPAATAPSDVGHR